MTDRDLMATQEFALARASLALALDVPTLPEAVELASLLHPFVGTVKIGLELYLQAGAQSIAAFGGFDVDVFLDLKLHDIPTTAERAARVVGALGARYVSVHTAGGLEMMHAAVRGLAEGAQRVGLLPPVAAGVTVLSSDAVASPTELARRASIAARGGCGALVCAAPDLPVTRAAAPGLVAIVPGTRPEGSSHDDQHRTLTPRAAVELGADLLIVGRPVTRAADPATAAYAIATSLIGARGPDADDPERTR